MLSCGTFFMLRSCVDHLESNRGETKGAQPLVRPNIDGRP
jgi:hypothetical protein